MPNRRLEKFMESNRIPYDVIHHDTAYTAQECAAAAHVPGQELAKSVIVKVDDKLVMAVLPATYRIDLEEFGEIAGGKAALAKEEEFDSLFPDCATGAMPPFGNLYGIEVYAAEKLAEDEEIVFNAGNHYELMRVRFSDFEAQVHPHFGRFARV